MKDYQKKRNLYVVLFFLAILFVGLGFSHGAQISGQYSRYASYPETWSVSCTYPTPKLAGDDLAKTLYTTFGCGGGATQTYCEKAVRGEDLPKNIHPLLSCPSLTDRTSFVRSCQTVLASLCPPKSLFRW